MPAKPAILAIEDVVLSSDDTLGAKIRDDLYTLGNDIEYIIPKARNKKHVLTKRFLCCIISLIKIKGSKFKFLSFMYYVLFNF